MTSSHTPWTVSQFYSFVQIPLERIQTLKVELLGFQNLKGTVILGTEGVNGSIAGSAETIQQIETWLCEQIGLKNSIFKHHQCQFMPFRRWLVKIKKEIVGLGRPDITPFVSEAKLDAKDWHAAMSENDVQIIDTRNLYESELGTFENAICPPIEDFKQFPKWVKTAPLDPSKKTLIFCTGGIRCEKASVAMKEMGFQNVYQLQDGIIKYLEEFPNQKFKGECFVFDHRVAVTQDLTPTTHYVRCNECGQPHTRDYVCTFQEDLKAERSKDQVSV